MRLARLDLIRYGKFTDRSVDLPRSPCDFHMVVGRNEAGKSTMRQAVYDLFYGFHVHSPLDFLHPKSELRLGALIEHAGGTLEFHRVKGNKNTIRDDGDTPLPDTTLAPYLGKVTGDFFNKMFGLDHPRLIKGSNDMLKAQDDVGQVLFQAAAGVASLGTVYEALQAEAAALWAPRKSKDRLWYAALAQLDEATAALKDATVRPRDWADANHRVAQLREDGEQQAAKYRELLARRERLERVRRLAPGLNVLLDTEHRLAEMGAVIEFSDDAENILNTAELELARADQRRATHTSDIARLEASLAALQIDDAVLAISADIEVLEMLRHRYSSHPQSIERYLGEVNALWIDACEAGGQLGWRCVDTDALQARLPGLPLRRRIEQLIRDHDALVRNAQASVKAVRDRQTEMDTLAARVEVLDVVDVSPALQAAVSLASALGEPYAAARKAGQAVTAARADLARAMEALRGWSGDVTALRMLASPSRQAVGQWAIERQALLSEVRSARKRHDDLIAEQQDEELALAQYRQLHKPVTGEDVGKARAQRDEAWQDIRGGRMALDAVADTFQHHVEHADQLADARLDNAQEAAELQNRVHRLARVRQQCARAAGQLQQLDAALEAFDAQWSGVCRRLGLAAMPVDHASEWLTQKERVLEAAQRLETAQQDEAALLASQEQARVGLQAALQASGLAAAGDDLAALQIKAGNHILSVESARANRLALNDQLAQCKPILAALQEAESAADAALAQWRHEWADALGKAGLPANSDTAFVAGALGLMQTVEERLGAIRQRRVEHIDVMRAELVEFKRMALKAAALIGDGDPDHDPAQISRMLATRLSASRQAHEQARALSQELSHAKSQMRLADESIQTAEASLRPLLDRAGVQSNDLLAQAIKRSDQYRRLRETAAITIKQLLENGGGWNREQIQHEVQSADLEALATELSEVHAAIETAAAEQSRLAVEQADAQRQLDAISGNDAAARAEARRQEALAQMADAAERYIRVHTAARMLRWSIDRYREDKQGPMLARAGTIFSRLTLGSFDRLVVDFDHQPMMLEGMRADGSRVGIGGLSDGTRDQLYLALRLAALELHLEHAAPMPFIADDLFINFDDSRAKAGLEALARLSRHTQVIFLSHHDHLVETARAVFGADMNLVAL
ncbi:MAG TPA: AAA family ATPase [Candidimonas sp.]|nr:AAA family ATPase [Candidimonas sp.]